MAASKHFKNNIDLSKLLRSMKIGDSVFLEISDTSTQQQALNALTSCGACRKSTSSERKYNVASERVEITTSYYSALTPLQIEKLTRLIKVTKTNHYTI